MLFTVRCIMQVGLYFNTILFPVILTQVKKEFEDEISN